MSQSVCGECSELNYRAARTNVDGNMIGHGAMA
uniref:Uncharacterized protein n=1 Tax=Physcomitrium patens TaxID=3218 RepID=A0A2K1KUN0_PHYPA|nr:hypothetical protein PHYPA_004454 [Physcomitrium patens]